MFITGNNQRSNYRISRSNNVSRAETTKSAQVTTRNFELSHKSLEKSGKRTNAIGLNGKPLKCRICESILHLMRDCPHRNESKNEDFTFFTGDEMKSCMLLSESRCSTILDPGCTSNVAGTLWIDLFLKTLQACDLNKVKKCPSTKMFRFGG